MEFKACFCLQVCIVTYNIFILHTKEKIEETGERGCKETEEGQRTKSQSLIPVCGMLRGIPHFSNLSSESDICNLCIYGPYLSSKTINTWGKMDVVCRIYLVHLHHLHVLGGNRVH